MFKKNFDIYLIRNKNTMLRMVYLVIEDAFSKKKCSDSRNFTNTSWTPYEENTIKHRSYFLIYIDTYTKKHN